MLKVQEHRKCLGCGNMSNHFKHLSDEELNRVDSSRFEAAFKKKEIIFKQDAPISHVIFMYRGYVKIYIEGATNQDLILSITKGTSYITGPGLYYKGVYSYSAQALTDLSACFVEVNLFKELIVENKNFANSFLEEFCRRSVNTLDSYLNSTQRKMPGRLAGGLIYLSESVFNSLKFDPLINRKELGELTGMSKESVIRSLREFQDEKLITIKDETIEIINLDQLKKICQYG